MDNVTIWRSAATDEVRIEVRGDDGGKVAISTDAAGARWLAAALLKAVGCEGQIWTPKTPAP